MPLRYLPQYQPWTDSCVLVYAKSKSGRFMVARYLLPTGCGCEACGWLWPAQWPLSWDHFPTPDAAPPRKLRAGWHHAPWVQSDPNQPPTHTHFWHLVPNERLKLLLLETQHAQLQDAWCVSTLVQLARGFGLRAIFETVGAMLLAKGLSSSIAIHHSRR